MVRKPWGIVSEVVDMSDVLLLLFDSRMVEESRNKDIEKLVIESGKPLIYVLTKCDLVDRHALDKWKARLHPCVFVSSTKYHGLNLLTERIMIEAGKAGMEKKGIRVGVLGYPNAGKSSLVNAMTGRGAAQTSIVSGHTRAKKYVTSARGIVFVDTPGVIPLGEKGDVANAVIGAVDFSKEKDPDLAVMLILERYPGKIERYYGVEKNDDPDEVIAAVARKNRIMARGDVPDMRRAAVKILKDWQLGLIR